MKIICIGKNYVNHAKEMGSTVPKEPLFFLKPDSAILPKNHPFFIPDFSREIHYEIELIIKIKKLGKHIEKRFAPSYYSEIGLGIDFTARDLQNECKINGHPWEKAKAFDHSAVIGTTFYSIEKFNEIHFELKKNGNLVQQGNANNMVFDFDEIIQHVSKFMTLKIGDIIFTGTPEGVGPIKIGDKLEGFLNGKKIIDLNVK
ncbi:MAG: fumarylacetoacetate hydrolase family protein [Bacteroidota bacterium]|nr:fumarylacetoacetate hydrolase family protein [Bacteroidota bacterium]